MTTVNDAVSTINRDNDNFINIVERSAEDLISIRDFEALVWQVEGIRIVVRTNSNSKVSAYNYSKSCASKWTLAKWLKRRVLPKLPDDVEVIVINGDGSINYSLQTQLSTQRLSYNRYDI